MFINVCWGEVIDEVVLFSVFWGEKLLMVVFDVFDNEFVINIVLFDYVWFVILYIVGYFVEGKVCGM